MVACTWCSCPSLSCIGRLHLAGGRFRLDFDLGALFIAVSLFLPNGIAGLFQKPGGNTGLFQKPGGITGHFKLGRLE